MKSFFITKIELNTSEGISKKVLAQARALNDLLGQCYLISNINSYAMITNMKDGSQRNTNKKFFDYIIEEIEKKNVDFIYIRLMVPSLSLLKCLKKANKFGVKVFYEIPTYPYFYEQFKTSRKKYRAIAKILLDIIFWPFIYRRIDKLVIIRSNSKKKKYKKMIEINNGIFNELPVAIRKKDDVFRMVTVGTLYPYHGYDRVLKGLHNCNEEINGIKVEMHIIGKSQTIDELKELAKELNLKNVYFLGVKSTEELNDLFTQYDIGLGCLALYRRKADIDTTLKVVEYFCRGIPVVSSGFCPLEGAYLKINNTNEPIDISQLLSFGSLSNEKKRKEISKKANKLFSWNSIFEYILKEGSIL